MVDVLKDELESGNISESNIAVWDLGVTWVSGVRTALTETGVF